MSRENYFPQVFIPQNLEHAKEIILTSDPTSSKWIEETNTTAETIINVFEKHRAPLTSQSLVLDYGCGIGRMAKKIIELSGCSVIGADISPGMLYHSVPYVHSDRFILCPQSQIGSLTQRGLKVDAAISIWTLQHCFNPAEDISAIHNILKPDGLFFVVNKFARYLPVTPVNTYVGWHDDKIDILTLLQENFELLESIESLGNPSQDYFHLYKKK